MRVLIINNAAPFIRGGAEELADQLVRRLNATKGVEAELLRIPFRWEPADCLAEQIILNRNLRLYQVDRVIALKFPAYLIPHPTKTLWLLHQFRQAYDLYESGMSHLCNHPAGERIAKLVRNADAQCFRDCRAIYTNSPVTLARLRKYNGIDAAVLYPPLLDGERFVGGEYGDYIFAGGRIGPGKRQHLLIEAMRHVRSSVNLVIAGPLDDANYGRRLQALVAENDLAPRVDLRFGFRSRDEIASLANQALACSYLPIDEDSMGYVTMEACSAGKSVITADDSGGVLELVRHGETGFVVAADPERLAEHFDRLAYNKSDTIGMGRAAKSLLDSKGLSWEFTIGRLLSG
jgi:glycosyltransferase involved in cell wall biosynthesis